MALTFTLRPSKAASKAIYYREHSNGDKLMRSTGLSVKPGQWDKAKQRVKSNHPQSILYNSRLEEIEKEYNKALEATGKAKPSISDIKQGLKAETKPRLNFFEYYELNLQRLKRLVSEKRIESYRSTLVTINKYIQHTGKRFDFNTINIEFYYSFTEYMETVLHYSPNTIGAKIKDLKAVMNNATEDNRTDNTAHKHSKFTVNAQDVDNIYLTENELERLYNLNLKDDLKLERARDLFLVHCWSGLRFSDFANIKIQGDFMHIDTSKTGASVVIPIHSILKEIISKYNGLPPSISNTWLNKYIKEIGRLAGITDVVTIRTKNGSEMFKRYELITSHTARRSFATNNYKAGVPVASIMAITGHKTEAMFFKYIKITPQQHAETIREHWINAERSKMKVV